MNKTLLNTLVCPVSKAQLEFDAAAQELRCAASGLAYPVRDGMPMLLESEAREMLPDEIEALRR